MDHVQIDQRLQTIGDQRARWRVVMLTSIGGAIEFYDFIVYAIFAQYISAAFFPSDDQFLSYVNTFAVFAVGYAIRPLGGAIFSHFGDKYGRRPVFLWSLLTISLASIAMGLMPPYAVGGAAATIAFVALRLIQSACFGGEIGGAVAYVVETAQRRAGLACGLMFGLLTSGVMLATGINKLIHMTMAPADVAFYGWRIAFILGGILGIVGYIVRGALEESPAFLGMRAHAKQPLGELARNHMAPVLVAFAVSAATGALNGLMFGYMPSYLVKVLNYAPADAASAISLGTGVAAICYVLVGMVSDSMKRYWLHRIGCVVLIITAWPVFQALAGHAYSPMLVLVMLAICSALVNGTIGVVLADLFPTRVRASGISMSYNVAMALFQGTTPLIATLLIGRTGNPISPAYWLIGMCTFSLLAGMYLKRYSGNILRNDN